MKKFKIAILGSTSHIAKGLVNNFLCSGDVGLHLYTRSPVQVRSFLRFIGKSDSQGCWIHKGYGDFQKYSYEVIINCVGAGTLKKLQGDYVRYFTLTEEYDNLVLRYLQERCPHALYISLSSGAVYGRDFAKPVEAHTANSLRVNHITSEDYYAIARLNAEAKHRAFKDLRIIDLRLFSYFSRFADLQDGYLITEVLDCILRRKVFVTNNINIVRDYVHPQDLFSIIQQCITAGKMNAAMDVSSAKPIEKKEILDYFSAQYGLKYRIKQSANCLSATGSRNIYYSKYRKASVIGYKPKFSSRDTIQQEAAHILTRPGVADLIHRK